MDGRRALGWALVGVQLVLLAALVLLPAGTGWTVPPWLSTALRAVQLLGLVVAGWALLGLRRSLTAHPAPVAGGELRTGGAYRFSRHPVYSGLMLFGVATAVRSGSPWTLVAFVALVALFHGKARWEEAMLAERYPGYARYAAATPRFIPRLRRHAGS